MANRHFAKIGDVWKHLPLAELLAIERPSRYGETHAGSGAYELVDDPERRFGVLHLLNAATGSALADARYLTLLRDLNDEGSRLTLYPGSAVLAMLALGPGTEYVLCDTDPESVADLEGWTNRRALTDRVRVVHGDGMSAIGEAFLNGTTGFVHIDPFDPDAKAGRWSAIELAAELIDAGISVMYWYGYDQPDDREWALSHLADAAERALWCGDMLVTSGHSSPQGGHLGTATTPGTGFGIVCANVSDAAIARCEGLGRALARAYTHARLPSGEPGGLDFRARSARSMTGRRRASE